MVEDLYVESDAIGLPSGVIQRLTFEEQVTNRNIKQTARGGRQVTLLNGPCNDVSHLVSNLCPSHWIRKAHNT